MCTSTVHMLMRIYCNVTEIFVSFFLRLLQRSDQRIISFRIKILCSLHRLIITSSLLLLLSKVGHCLSIAFQVRYYIDL